MSSAPGYPRSVSSKHRKSKQNIQNQQQQIEYLYVAFFLERVYSRRTNNIAAITPRNTFLLLMKARSDHISLSSNRQPSPLIETLKVPAGRMSALYEGAT